MGRPACKLQNVRGLGPIREGKAASSLVVNAGHIEVVVSRLDLNLGACVDASALAQGNELVDGFPAVAVEVVIPEDSGVARVGEEVCVAQGNAMLWKGPMLLRAPCMAPQ